MTIVVAEPKRTKKWLFRIFTAFGILVLIFSLLFALKYSKTNDSPIELRNDTKQTPLNTERGNDQPSTKSAEINPGNYQLPNAEVLAFELVKLNIARDNSLSGQRLFTLYSYCRLKEPDPSVRALMNRGIVWKMNTNRGVLLFGPQQPGVPQRAIQTHGRGDFTIEAQIPDSITEISELIGVVRCIRGHDQRVVTWNDPRNEIGSVRGENAYRFSLLSYDDSNDAAKIHYGVKTPKGAPFEPDYWSEYLTEFRLITSDGTIFSGVDGGLETKTASYPLAGKLSKRIEIQYYNKISQEFYGFRFQNLQLPENLDVPTKESIKIFPAGSKRYTNNSFIFSLESSIFESTVLPEQGTSSRVQFNINVSVPKGKSVYTAPTFLKNATIINADNVAFSTAETPEFPQVSIGDSFTVRTEFPYSSRSPIIRALKFSLPVFIQEELETILLPLDPDSAAMVKSGVTRHAVQRLTGVRIIRFSVDLTHVATRDLGAASIHYEILDRKNQKIQLKGASVEVVDDRLIGELLVDDKVLEAGQSLKVEFPKKGYLEEIPVEFNNIYLRAHSEDSKKTSDF